MVVTFYDPQVSKKRKGMTVHDATGSVYVRLDLGYAESLAAGTLIDLHGISALGEFAPVIDHPQFQVIKYAGFPADAPRPMAVSATISWRPSVGCGLRATRPSLSSAATVLPMD